jgi:VanZ family protein
MKKMLQLWLPVVLWAALIFGLSGIPKLDSGLELDYILRKMAHVTEYAILTCLLWRALKGYNLAPVYLVAYPALISLLYAVSDEFHQSFVPGRQGSASDVVIDSIGIAVFFVIRKIFKL